MDAALQAYCARRLAQHRASTRFGLRVTDPARQPCAYHRKDLSDPRRLVRRISGLHFGQFARVWTRRGAAPRRAQAQSDQGRARQPKHRPRAALRNERRLPSAMAAYFGRVEERRLAELGNQLIHKLEGAGWAVRGDHRKIFEEPRRRPGRTEKREAREGAPGPAARRTRQGARGLGGSLR